MHDLVESGETGSDYSLSEIVLTQSSRNAYYGQSKMMKHWRNQTDSLHAEIPALGAPRASRFRFSMSVIAGNASLYQTQICELSTYGRYGICF
jgi:hypothetical protein